MTQLPTSWIGCTLNGRYHIESLLGQGGMSTVYRATDPNLQRTVAVKIIHPNLTDNPQFVQRFEQEATAVARLRHPNIVQVHDFNHHEGIYYMVLEYIPGETLAQKLQDLNDAQAHMLPAQSVRILSDLCLAVDYAHQRGMVHRDLKPANVMINRLGEPVLMDFGIAKLLGSPPDTLSQEALGTARYMSPEQVAGDTRGQTVDHRADIYALGVMLFEMTTGQPPFTGASTTDILSKHLNEPVPDVENLNAALPPALTAVITTALAKDPAHRYQSAADMATALQSVGLHLQEFSGPLGARHWQHLSRLLQQAQTAAASEDFTGCLEKLDELERTGADFAPEKVTQLRQAAQTRLYERAVQHFQAGQFDESLALVELLRPLDPDSPHLSHLETQIRQSQKTTNLQANLDQLYDEAIAHLAQGNYDAALAAWQAIESQHGRLAYTDRLQVEQLAKEGICIGLYTRALTAVAVNQPAEALRLWAQIRDVDAHYPDTDDVAGQAERLLQQQQQQTTWQRRLIVVVPLILLLGLAGWWLGRNRLAGGEVSPQPTTTILAAMIAPTETVTATAPPTAVSTPTAVTTQPPAATQTSAPPATPQPSPSPAPTETVTGPILATDVAFAKEDASIFASPRTNSPELAVVALGEQLQVLGRSEVRNWLFVDNGEVAGFIFQPLLQWDGDLSTLPVYTYTDAAPTNNAATASPTAVGGPITSLKLDLWTLPGTAQCSGSGWRLNVFMQGQGGNGRYRYYWNGQFLVGPTSTSHTFTVNSGGGVIIGVGRVVSDDGQAIERELFIPIPTCADGS